MPEDAPNALALIDYASPRAAREPWGPWLFRPSRRSLALVALTALACIWLACRHEPWRRVGTVPADQQVRPAFTADGQILAFDSRAGAGLYDPATARRGRTVLPTIDVNTYRYFPLAGGTQILALPYIDRVALVYDVASGRVVERLPNPDGLGSNLIAVAPDAPRVVTHGIGGGNRRFTNGYRAWDLKGPVARVEPVALGQRLRLGAAEFSPDGKHLLVHEHFAENAPSFEWFDGKTFVPIRRETIPGRQQLVATGFGDGERLWVARVEPAGQMTARMVLDVRSARTGELIRTVPLASSGAGALPGGIVVSADLRRAALHHAGPLGDTLDVVDLERGQSVTRRVAPDARPVGFFPGSARLLVADNSLKRLAILGPPHTQPLALLPPGSAVSLAHAPEISPDGRTILAAADPAGAALAVFRPAGWDCPESRFGAFAFPHVWLAFALVATLSLSLLADASRARGAFAARPVSPWLVAGLAVVAIPLTARALAAACIGRPSPTVAPLLLLAAIGLATHARVWRLIALILLSATLPWIAYLLFHAQATTRRGDPIPWTPLDRTFDLPAAVSLGGLVVGVLLVTGAIVLLAAGARRMSR